MISKISKGGYLTGMLMFSKKPFGAGHVSLAASNNVMPVTPQQCNYTMEEDQVKANELETRPSKNISTT